MNTYLAVLMFFLLTTPPVLAQAIPLVGDVEPQPFVAHAMRVDEALTFLGSSLQPEDRQRLARLKVEAPSPDVVTEIQQILDPYVLAFIDISPEARVKVERGPAEAKLVQHGWKSFLVKVHNHAGVRAPLEAGGPNAAPLLHSYLYQQRPVPEEHRLTPGDIANRFLEIAVYRRRPMLPNLSGLPLEYAIVQIYTKDSGLREARLEFHVGQGTQDIGFRNGLDVLFEIEPAVKVVLGVKDTDGTPAMASFIITDGVERLAQGDDLLPKGYRNDIAYSQPWDFTEGVGETPIRPKRLVGLYPLPSRRLATDDAYPDFFFQPQVYRADGEHVLLPPGTYDVRFTRGPEYVVQHRRITVPEGVETHEETFQLKRWIDLSSLGWYSADHHIHAAGCTHYESPEEGVRPEHMWRQILGEDLDLAAVLTWGPGWYHQKQFFDGHTHPLSTEEHVMRYDVEVSGFPSSHAGHVCLLRLTEDDYPGTSVIEDWPSWTLPVLRWAEDQGAITGYAHSGWGLEPVERTFDLPNYIPPKMDGIGANEFVVAVTHDLVDFYSAGDTPPTWELNTWYHTLNAGFRPRLSGETDFPCIFDERVGMARTYARLDGELNFDAYMQQVKAGRSYVSDGASHLVDFKADEVELGVGGSELRLDGPAEVTFTARVAAMLPETQDSIGTYIAGRPEDQRPYWDIERARIDSSRKVPVELIVNGYPVGRRVIEADGSWQDVSFTYPVERSSWAALRIYPSSHTNPIFMLVDGEPIRASRRSAAWLRNAVDRCWEMKSPLIREDERAAAAAAYDHARQVYDRILAESSEE